MKRYIPLLVACVIIILASASICVAQHESLQTRAENLGFRLEKSNSDFNFFRFDVSQHSDFRQSMLITYMEQDTLFAKVNFNRDNNLIWLKSDNTVILNIVYAKILDIVTLVHSIDELWSEEQKEYVLEKFNLFY